MNYCQYCGEHLPKGARVCPKCGRPIPVDPAVKQEETTNNQAVNTTKQETVLKAPNDVKGVTESADPDKGSFGWALLAFFIPLVGLVLFLVWRKSMPLNANSAGIGALVGCGFSVILFLSVTLTAGLAA